MKNSRKYCSHNTQNRPNTQPHTTGLDFYNLIGYTKPSLLLIRTLVV